MEEALHLRLDWHVLWAAFYNIRCLFCFQVSFLPPGQVKFSPLRLCQAAGLFQFWAFFILTTRVQVWREEQELESPEQGRNLTLSAASPYNGLERCSITNQGFAEKAKVSFSSFHWKLASYRKHVLQEGMQVLKGEKELFICDCTTHMWLEKDFNRWIKYDRKHWSVTKANS